MPLNLITDSWIPVRMMDGSHRVIRPDQIAETGVERPDWERPDFNLACYELLIGLVYLADPPEDEEDWADRRAPDQVRLRERLLPLAPAFNLDGDGPRFLQDLEELDVKVQPIDLLIIDCAGITKATLDKNADVLVKRKRYETETQSWAAIALFTLQSYTPGGGGGHRSSMRGRGPLITLVEPKGPSKAPLWDMVWANVPDGEPTDPTLLRKALPWMRPTNTSEKGKNPVAPPESNSVPPETFFGMPQRIRLHFSDQRPEVLTGVSRKKSGTKYLADIKNKKYALWQHPLSPYTREKVGGMLRAVGANKAGVSYKNWVGTALQKPDGLKLTSQNVRTWSRKRAVGEMANLQVGGWSMHHKQAEKVVDFIWCKQPLFPLDDRAQNDTIALVEAANAFSRQLAEALQFLTITKKKDAKAKKENKVRSEDSQTKSKTEDATAVAAIEEAFFIETQNEFEEMLARLSNGAPKSELATEWRDYLRAVAMRLFEDRALPGLSSRDTFKAEKIVQAHGQLRAAFSGRTKFGKDAFKALGLELPKASAGKESTG